MSSYLNNMRLRIRPNGFHNRCLYLNDDLEGDQRIELEGHAADPEFNPGAGNDFAIEFLIYPYSDTPTGNRIICAKSPGWLGAGEKGWMFRWDGGTDDDIVIYLNDGNSVVLSNYYSGILTVNNWGFYRFEFIRDGCVRAYKNGILFDDTWNISSRAGDLSNAYNLTIGCCDGSYTDRWVKMRIGVFRFDYGQGSYDWDLGSSEDWNLREYYKLMSTWRENPGHYALASYFENTLKCCGRDMEAYNAPVVEYEWTWNGAQGPYYAYGHPSSREYELDFNPIPTGYERSFADSDAILRNLSGQLKRYRKMTPRQYKYLVFRTTDLEQVTVLQGLYFCETAVYLQEVRDKTPYRGYHMIAPPIVTEIARDNANNRVWEIELELEEI